MIARSELNLPICAAHTDRQLPHVPPSRKEATAHLRSRPDALLDPLCAVLVRLVDELEGFDVYIPGMRE